MRVSFFVADEGALTEESMLQAAAQGPHAVASAIARHAGPWGEVEVTPEDYAAVFRVLDEALKTGDFLVDLAFAGSPHLVLTGHPGPWRLGYFEASLVQHLQPVFNALADSIGERVAALPGNAGTVYLRLCQSMADAFLRNGAVAIIHLS
jgi:hypothetical protein